MKQMERIPTRERGAALIVGLVLLLIMTVLGVSGMGTAALELVMAGNAESQQDAFQAAETGIDIAIDRRNWTTFAPTDLENIVIGAGSVEGETVNSDCTIYPNSAFSAGVTGGVMAYHFDTDVVGTGPRGARSSHTQSFYVAGPSPC
jgi:type IV pilus assembly protein PilX